MPISINSKAILLAIVFTLMGSLSPHSVKAQYDYQLYKNFENFGVLIFPKNQIFLELDQYIKQIGFEHVESGRAVMRFGSKNENETYMMPELIQKKYSISQFIVLQVVAKKNILVGVVDPEWGLTLPSPIYNLSGIKENILKTLNIFRKILKKRETQVDIPRDSKRARLLIANFVNIPTKNLFLSELY